MCKILIFGGTTEGRLLAEFCDKEQIHAYISVTTEYGKELLPESEYLTVQEAAMDRQEMEHFIEENRIGLVIDATHPYARVATDHIRTACQNTGVARLRCIRTIERTVLSDTVYVGSAEEAAGYLRETTGNILLTTGSKELAAFTGDPQLLKRIYARVLPSAEVLLKCTELGIEKSHIIAMQGPFSEELNLAVLRQIGAAFLVTKETGSVGGYEEKIEAAGKCGVLPIVISCEREPEQTDFLAVCQKLKAYAKEKSPELNQISFTLAGIGPGHASQMTEGVIQAICGADVLFGAPRVLEAAKAAYEAYKGKENIRKAPRWIPAYLPHEIGSWLQKENRETVRRAVLLFSGDTGFYSGAEKAAKWLAEQKISFSLLPGISSVSYLASKLGINWNEADIDTAHGRDFNPSRALRGDKKKIFVLAGGENGAAKLCSQLCDCGFAEVIVTVGEKLSYPEERITSGAAKKLKEEKFDSLSLVLIEKGENR